MATRRDYHDPPTVPDIPVVVDGPPAPPTPTDERIKLGIAAGSFVAMLTALALGKELIAAPFGVIVTTVAGHYFNNRKG